MEQNEILLAIQQGIAELKKTIPTPLPINNVSNKWVPRPDVMRFFNYAPTQMASFEKEEGLVISKIGKRKFYHRDSIEKLLEKNIINPKK